MNSDPPDPSERRETRKEMFLEYLDYYRLVVVEKVEGLTDDELRRVGFPHVRPRSKDGSSIRLRAWTRWCETSERRPK